MKILSAKQIREADAQTIAQEPIASIDLMERAAERIFHALTARFAQSTAFIIICGKGNNGGDGLALARMLYNEAYPVDLRILNHQSEASVDFKANFKRLPSRLPKLELTDLPSWEDPSPEVVIVDAILGSGLSRPLEGLLKDMVQHLNQLPNIKVSIDIPTGLFAEDNSHNDLRSIFKAQWTLSLQLAKASFYHRDTAVFTGDVSILDIGLNKEYISQAESANFLFGYPEAKRLFKPRSKFSYKGTFGHAFLLAGSTGSTGAAVLSGMACLRSGAGLLTICAPTQGVLPIQTLLPEAMVEADINPNFLTRLPNLDKAAAVGMGPGIGTSLDTGKVLKLLLQEAQVPMVLDADALNILAENPTWLAFLPPMSIITPHIGEFRRLLGVQSLGSDYLEKLREFSSKQGVVVVLKDAITCVASPTGDLYYIDEGSPALATAGSGDILTGVILGLLSSGYEPLQAALLGVYLHGVAGNMAGEEIGLESSIARDVTNNLGAAFQELYN